MERKLIVKDIEITNLIESWSLYQGNVITINKVQNWLMQFGDLYIQREIFEVLKKIKFISRDDILKGLRYAYKMAINELDFEIATRQRLRDDIYVSYLDGAGKSGAWIAHQFKDVNGILKQNILELSQLGRVTQEVSNPFKKMKALVLADDFSGTGQTLIDELSNNIDMIKALTEKHSVKVILYSAFAMEEGRERIINFVKSVELTITPIFGQIFDDSERMFSNVSRYFNNEEIKEKVRFIMTEFGNKIVSKNPLGFGDCEVGIIFPENCPNNTLPVFWAKKSSSAFNWQPLFPRLLN